MPLGHHDLACHLKSPTHCTTCTVGSSAEAAVDPAVLARFWLLEIGAAAAASRSAPNVPCRPRRRPAAHLLRSSEQGLDVFPDSFIRVDTAF